MGAPVCAPSSDGADTQVRPYKMSTLFVPAMICFNNITPNFFSGFGSVSLDSRLMHEGMTELGWWSVFKTATCGNRVI